MRILLAVSTLLLLGGHAHAQYSSPFGPGNDATGIPRNTARDAPSRGSIAPTISGHAAEPPSTERHRRLRPARPDDDTAAEAKEIYGHRPRRP